MLTGDRAKKLSDYLLKDTEKAQKLLDLPVDDAQKIINAEGNDFTIDELKDFGKVMEQVSKTKSENDELNEEDLTEVAGGIVISGAVLAAGVALFTAGITFGYTVARDRGW